MDFLISALKGIFCPCCMICRNARDLGESGTLMSVLSCFAPCVPIYMLRTAARHKYNIDGTFQNDALCSYCFAPFVNCQTAAEIDHQGDH